MPAGTQMGGEDQGREINGQETTACWARAAGVARKAGRV